MSKVIKGLQYGFYILLHPFDGFWCMKREKKGNTLSALLIVVLLVCLSIFEFLYTGYIKNPVIWKYVNVAWFFYTICGGFALWCISNWCVTSLVDGEGTFKDIFNASAYALLPVVLFKVPLVLISRIITADEITLVNLVSAAVIVWSGILFFIGIMTIHQFSFAKTLATIVIAVLGMAIIIYLGVLFIALIQQIINFIMQIVTEVSNR